MLEAVEIDHHHGESRVVAASRHHPAGEKVHETGSIGETCQRIVEGVVTWHMPLVLASVMLGVPLCGVALLAEGHPRRPLRYFAAPLLLGAIVVLHFCGMAAMHLHADPTRRLPEFSVSPATITPIVAGVSLAILALAICGMRFDIAARARQRWERKRLGELAGVALEGLLICDGDRIVTANSSMERLAGRTAGELAGTSLETLLPGLDLETLPEREEREIDLVRETGDPVPVRALRSQVRIGRKQQTVVAVRDQSERLRTEAKMRALHAFNEIGFLSHVVEQRDTDPDDETGSEASILAPLLEG
ncbi:PAS domain S-box-containing protein [Sphingomonas sp. BE138]|uniref:MHYT domain-containing protein n=1 Tax=Sphingomonas sp. BE138 TaxID=2817845 RepID=UPI00285D2D9A|nr:MHYT domain-containing protein [Sphingomonas sp. BE138]MDR6790326.1 PAS domain S-box-containing protein [Sphingomonas sp. BE138]